MGGCWIWGCWMLNVRLSMKLTVWPNMRLNGRLNRRLNVRVNVGWVAEWEVRLLNVRLNMKLTVWPTMRLNGRLLDGKLNGRLNVRLNGGLNGRLGCWMWGCWMGGWNIRLNVGLSWKTWCLCESKMWGWIQYEAKMWEWYVRLNMVLMWVNVTEKNLNNRRGWSLWMASKLSFRSSWRSRSRSASFVCPQVYWRVY